jgi:hypothetical protein
LAIGAIIFVNGLAKIICGLTTLMLKPKITSAKNNLYLSAAALISGLNADTQNK